VTGREKGGGKDRGTGPICVGEPGYRSSRRPKAEGKGDWQNGRAPGGCPQLKESFRRPRSRRVIWRYSGPQWSNVAAGSTAGWYVLAACTMPSSWYAASSAGAQSRHNRYGPSRTWCVSRAGNVRHGIALSVIAQETITAGRWASHHCICPRIVWKLDTLE
jgi:hypothetical protein